MNRRKFIRNVIGIPGLSAAFYAWGLEPYWLEFVHKKMPVANLPPALVGKTLMQISDIHVGNRFDWQFLIESFKRAAKLQPDFVVYTGDYVTKEHAKHLGNLSQVMDSAVKGKLATVGILGNHDYGKNWSDAEAAKSITKLLQDKGIRILRNEQTEAHGLNIIGFDDYWGLNFNPSAALSGYDASKANILLCHNPDVCDIDVWNGYKGWILAGHTHGGQVKPPFLDAPNLPVKNKRYDQGEIDLFDGRTLYINRALGHLWQVRFNVRPEITVFELRRDID
jgi:uncharacterized protein